MEVNMEKTEEKPKRKQQRRALLPPEFEVRDLTWAVGINCQCGHQLDLFTWNIPEERVCKKCGRKYSIKLLAYQEY